MILKKRQSENKRKGEKKKVKSTSLETQLEVTRSYSSLQACN